RIDLDVSTHEIVPGDFLVRQLEAPVRLPALGLEPLALRIAESQSGTVIDRWLLLRHLAFAFAVELGGSLVACIEATGGSQRLRGTLIVRNAVGLAREDIVTNTQPAQVFEDRVLEFPGRTRVVSVVDAQKKAPTLFGCE